MHIQSILASAALLLASVNGSATCIANLEFTGDPVNAFTRANLTEIFRQSPEALEQFPTGKIPVNHLRFEDLALRDDYEVPQKVKPRLTPMLIEGRTMMVRPAGRIARKIAEIGRAQADTEHPHEHYAVDYFDGEGYSFVSPLLKSAGPVELQGLEAFEVMDRAVDLGRASAPAGDLRREMVRLTHEHPVHECFVVVDDENIGFSCAPLSEADLDFARKMSIYLEDTAVVISAVTHGDVEYQAVFRDGQDVTARSYRLLARAERNLERGGSDVFSTVSFRRP